MENVVIIQFAIYGFSPPSKFVSVRSKIMVRLHSDAERGESPKLKIAKMSSFGLKTAFFGPKNDRST